MAARRSASNNCSGEGGENRSLTGHKGTLRGSHRRSGTTSFPGAALSALYLVSRSFSMSVAMVSPALGDAILHVREDLLVTSEALAVATTVPRMADGNPAGAAPVRTGRTIPCGASGSHLDGAALVFNCRSRTLPTCLVRSPPTCSRCELPRSREHRRARGAAA